MTYITNTITSATPGATLYAALEVAMLAQGWTLEDTVVIGTRTHKILKSAAAGNSRNLDWYIDISYTTSGAGFLMMAPFEGYTPAGDTGRRGPYSVNSTVFETTNYSWAGNTEHALETNWANSAAYSGLQTPLVTAAFIYRASITRDRVILFVSNSATTLHYCGFYTPTAAALAHQGASCFPLITTKLTANQASASSTSANAVTAAITRMPKYPDISSTYTPNGWGTSVRVTASDELMDGIAGAWVHQGNGEVAYSPAYVLMGTASPSVYGGLVGSLDGVLAGLATSSAAHGDTVTNGGDTYVMTTPASNFVYLMKQV